VLVIMAVIGGRVIPMFTNNADRGADAARRPSIEALALGSLVVLVAADAFNVPPEACDRSPRSPRPRMPRGSRCGIRGGPCASRWCGSCTWATRGSSSTSRCACRASSGGCRDAGDACAHRGRHRLPDARHDDAHRARTYGLALAAGRGDVRVLWAGRRRRLGARLLPDAGAVAHVAAVVVSGLCWAAAFGAYAFLYAPALVRARVDGRPG
jgi:uncharacterized protein involved in response to NO